MRKPIIAGNWKMNMTPAQTKELIDQLKPLIAGASCDVVICPPACCLTTAAAALKGTSIALGAQNIHWAKSGAFTGEISADMLLECGVSYAIVGHSERRQYFGETDETVNQRAKAAIAAGITPIICIGETLEEREQGSTKDVVKRQVTQALKGIDDMSGIVIAYEPIWAIGTGRTATVDQANETIGDIRDTIRELKGDAAALIVRILYGGSMNASNAEDLMQMPQIDGGLIGGASLKALDFSTIVAAANGSPYPNAM